MMKSSALFECGPLPHTSTSCPPDVIHIIGVPRPSPFFALFRFHVLRKLKNKKKTGEAWEQGYGIIASQINCPDPIFW